MQKEKLSDKDQVTLYIRKLPLEIQPVVECLRQIILSVHPDIAEHIKWNSPAFYFSGEMKAFDPKAYKRDILVMNLHKARLMCVLPTGAILRENTGILEGDFTDGRRLIHFNNQEDIKAKEELLKRLLLEWLSLVDK